MNEQSKIPSQSFDFHPYATNFYTSSCHYFSTSVRHGTSFLSTALDKMITCIIHNHRTQQPEVKEKLEKIWKYVNYSTLDPEDSLTRSVQKVFFAACVSLPSALILSDYTCRLNGSPLPPSPSIQACLSHIFTSHLYVHTLTCLIDSIVYYLDQLEALPDKAPQNTLLTIQEDLQ